MKMMSLPGLAMPRSLSKRSQFALVVSWIRLKLILFSLYQMTDVMTFFIVTTTLQVFMDGRTSSLVSALVRTVARMSSALHAGRATEAMSTYQGLLTFHA